MKKILIITNLPTPYRIDFYNELGKVVNLTVVVEGKRSQNLHFNWNDDNIKNFKIEYLSDILDEKKIYWSGIKKILWSEYDDLIISTYYTRTQTLLLILLKLLRKSYFFETDGGIINKNEKKIIRNIKRLLIGGAKGYFSPSSCSDKYLIYYGAKENKVHRYPFSSLREDEILLMRLTDIEKKKIRQKLGVVEDFVILGVGQFIHRKGFDVLIKACKDISSNVGIYIVGGEPTDEYVRLKEQFRLTNLHFEGFKSREELAEYFKCADLFVLPTREDIWGLVINEAMAYGLPVISTNNCVAALELLPKECVVPVEDVVALREQIDKILNCPEYRVSLAEHSLTVIKKGYSSTGMALAHKTILDNE